MSWTFSSVASILAGSVAKAVTSKKKTSPGRSASTRIVPVPREEIALRAYHIFLQRGSIHGWDVDDWLAAERELLGESKSKPVKRKKSEIADLMVQ